MARMINTLNSLKRKNLLLVLRIDIGNKIQ